MTGKAETRFVYVTYIRTTAERLWAALTDPEFAARYWLGLRPDSDWRAGSDWRLVRADGVVSDAGQILVSEPPRRLVIRWQHQLSPDFQAEGYSDCEMVLEDQPGLVKLTILHRIDGEGSRFIGAISWGWPQILSNLKTLIETGRTLPLAGPESAPVAEPDFRAPTRSQRDPRALVDTAAGSILAVAELAATPERVFQALTTREVEDWWRLPGLYRQKDWQADLRVPGDWSVTVELEAGGEVHAWGEFCVIDPHRRLVMTRRFDAHPYLGPRETTLHYCFDVTGSGTRLTVRDEGFLGRLDAAFGNAEIWEKILGLLQDWVERPS